MRSPLKKPRPSKANPTFAPNLAIPLCHLAVFLYLCVGYFQMAGTNPLYWDAASYFRSAIDWLSSPTLQHFRSYDRPIFSWPILLPLWFFNGTFSADSLTLIYNIFAVTTLTAASAFFLFTFGAPLALCCVPLALPLVFQLSTQFLADTLTAAACLTLNATVFLWQRQPSPKRLFVLGLVMVWGFSTKPIFIFWLGIQLVFTSAIARRFKIILPPLFLAAILGFLFLPYRLVDILSELHYHNEVLGYWRRFDGIYNHLLWFPTVFLKGTPLLLVAITFLVLVRRKIISRQPQSKDLLVWSGLPWLLATGYVSVVVTSKDERHFLFLTILFVLIVTAMTASRVVIPLAALLGTLGWPHPQSPFRYVYLLNQSVVTVRTPELKKFSNEERSLTLVAASLVEDCRARKCPKPFSVFSPHSSPGFNASALGNTFASWNRFKARHLAFSEPFKVKASTLRYGGWGSSGGFPDAFWESEYIVVIPGYTAGHLMGDTEIYNRKIADWFSAPKPWLLDGLSAVKEIPSPFGQIHIYHRDHPPEFHSVKQLAEQVRAFDEANPANRQLFAIAGLSKDPQ